MGHPTCIWESESLYSEVNSLPVSESLSLSILRRIAYLYLRVWVSLFSGWFPGLAHLPGSAGGPVEPVVQIIKIFMNDEGRPIYI